MIVAQNVSQPAIKSFSQVVLTMLMKPNRLTHKQKAKWCPLFTKGSASLRQRLIVDSLDP